MFFAYLNRRLLFAQPVISVALLLFLNAAAVAQGGRLDIRFPLLLSDGSDVTSILVQPDGKILIAGSFTTRGSIVREDIVRLNADGSIDSDFNAGTGASGTILSMALRPDGKIFIGGSFNQFNGVFGYPLVRLNSNGSLDSTFSATGLDMTFVIDVDVQPDGKVIASASNLIGSSFIARFDSAGINDPAFGQPFFFNGRFAFRIAFNSSEGKIVAASRGGPANQASLIKIAVAGGQDQTFQVPVTSSVPGGPIVDVSVIANGRMLVFGKFDAVNGVQRKNIAIVNADGSLDASFVPATSGLETILAAAVQPNGKIVIAGTSFATNGEPGGNIARLNADGSVDTTFDSGRGANGSVRAVGLDSNSSILVGGNFFRYRAYPRTGVVRLKP